MAPDDLNFRHLLYFWSVAKEGSVTRAAERLDLSVQAVSTQLGLLERQLGQALFAPQGRSLILTEAGRVALQYAERIFHLGDLLVDDLRSLRDLRPRFAVGIAETVPKLVAFRLLAPLLRPPLAVRLECCEGEIGHLLGELQLNRLDLVIADQSAPRRANQKLEDFRLGEMAVDLFGVEALHAAWCADFPNRIEGAPLLLPARTHPMRDALDHWFVSRGIRPEVVGEFTDSALLKTFGSGGLGLFPAPAGLAAEIHRAYDASSLGTLQGVRESWYGVVVPRRIQHPAILALREGVQPLPPLH